MDITPASATGHEDELPEDFDSTDGDLPPATGFGDHKAPGAFRTIGEVANALGIRQHVLRYWEEQFPMLSPVKRSGNRRYYRPEDVALIERIDRLVHREGYTLRGARLALEPVPKKAKRGAGDAPSDTARVEPADIAPAAPSAAGPWLDELQAIRATLEAALAA